MNRRIILASTSPRRKELLSKIVAEFEIVPSDYEEDMTLPMAPDALVRFLSKGKAESVAKSYHDAIIIGADTIVFYKGKVLGKPYTSEKAREMLNFLSGSRHSIFTGFTVIDTKSKKVVSKAVEARVAFKKLSEKQIDDYLETKEPLMRAGGYAIQTVGETFVEHIEGEYNSIVGLPIETLKDVLVEFGVEIKQ